MIASFWNFGESGKIRKNPGKKIRIFKSAPNGPIRREMEEKKNFKIFSSSEKIKRVFSSSEKIKRVFSSSEKIKPVFSSSEKIKVFFRLVKKTTWFFHGCFFGFFPDFCQNDPKRRDSPRFAVFSRVKLDFFFVH